MSKDNAVEDFLGQVNNIEPQEESPFANLEIEQQEEPIVEEEVEEKVPFHKDPKLQKYLDKREKEIEERILANLSPREEAKFREEAKEDGVIKAFENIIGNDTPEKVNALKILGQELEGIRQEARSAREQLEAEKRADREAEEQLRRGFEAVEEEFNVDFSNKKLKTEFVDFIQRVAPKDENGDIKDYPDFHETFRLFQEIKAKPANRSKELASRSMTRSGEASKAQIPTDTSWKGVEKFFSTLKG